MTDPVEKRNKRIGLSISIGLHSAIAVLFFFLLAWKAPYPPAAEYGIELNIGFDESGSGDVQPTLLQPDAEGSLLEENADNENTRPVDENIPDETIDQSEQSVNTESPVENTPDNTEVDNPEEMKEKTEEVKKTDPTPVNKTGQTSQNAGQENAGVKGDENKITSQGDKTDAKGDQGNPEGTIDARALYGTPGGGSGGALELAGWIWDFEPRPDDTSTENGKIVFEIKIDAEGVITSVRTLEKTVTPGVEKIYRESVEELTFSPLSTNMRPAASSTGKITFIIRSR